MLNVNLHSILILLLLRSSLLASQYTDQFETSFLDNDEDLLISSQDTSDAELDAMNSEFISQEDISQEEISQEELEPEAENISQKITQITKIEKIPITTSLKKISTRFIKLMNSSTFVDKTHFLETFFENRRRSQMNVITSPSGFGKTSLMDMIKLFAQTEVNEMGKPLKIENMLSFSIFANKSLNLNVSQSLSTIPLHLGQYPVMYLNFKKIIRKTDKASWKNLQTRIKKLFLEYRWMIDKINNKYKITRYDCTVNEKLQYSVIDKIIHNDKVNAETMEMSLFVFSEALYMHFKKRVLVLIDDFDDPLLEIATHREDDFPRSRVTRILGNMLDRLLVGIDKLRYVEVALLAGTAHVRLSTTFQSYGKLFKFNRFLDGHPYANYYGFTEKEVQLLFEKNHLDRKEIETVKKLHNGYTASIARNTISLYCPQSVISFLNQKVNQTNQPVLNLINNPSLNKFVQILKHDEIRIKISQLLLSKPLIFALARKMEYEDLEHLGQVFKDESPLDANAIRTFFTLLVDFGYFTNADCPKAKTTAFEVANFESLQGLAGFFYEYATSFDNIDLDSIAISFNDIFINDEVNEEMLIRLRKALRNLYPDEDNPDTNEYRMHSLIYSALLRNYLNDTTEVKINSDYDVETNTEIRADIFIKKRSKAMVLEIRQDITAKEALQIAERSFNKWKTKRKLKTIKYLGISFNEQKKVRIGYKDSLHQTPIIIKRLPRRKE